MLEGIIGECQLILNLTAPPDVLLARLKGRGETSGRKDDQDEETLKKRLKEFDAKTRPAIEYYNQFGKVRTVDGSGTIEDVYKLIQKAILPEIFLVIGSKGSGKTTVSQFFSERTNMKYMNFIEWASKPEFVKIRKNNIELTKRLIDELKVMRNPRLIIDGFPENLQQMQYYLRNMIPPEKVLLINSSEEISLKRNKELGPKSKDYLDPAILCKMIRQFHAESQDLIKFLKAEKFLTEVQNGTTKNLNEMKEMTRGMVNPEILLVRNHERSQAAMIAMVNELASGHGYKHLDVPLLRREETTRKTAIGKQMLQ